MTPTPSEQALMDAAVKASSNAYAPYSGYRVGAAVQATNGDTFAGCNVENASYGLTNCAERTAIYSAVANGHLGFNAIAIATRDGGAPCGACRQVINEFAPDAIVLIGNDRGEMIRRYAQARELLPDAFGPHNVESE